MGLSLNPLPPHLCGPLSSTGGCATTNEATSYPSGALQSSAYGVWVGVAAAVCAAAAAAACAAMKKMVGPEAE